MKDVADIVRSGEDLRAFKAAIAQFASDVPLDASAQVREKRLRERAAEIIDAWQKYRVAAS